MHIPVWHSDDFGLFQNDTRLSTNLQLPNYDFKSTLVFSGLPMVIKFDNIMVYIWICYKVWWDR